MNDVKSATLQDSRTVSREICYHNTTYCLQCSYLGSPILLVRGVSYESRTVIQFNARSERQTPIPFREQRTPIKVCSHPSEVHQSVTNRNDNQKRDNARWDTTANEVLDLEVSLSCLRVFHHDSSYIKLISSCSQIA